MLGGQVIDNAQLGCTTVTVKLQLVLPLVSYAVLVTVVVPRLKLLPEGGIEFTVGSPPQESLAITTKNTLVGTLEVTMMLGGQMIDTTQFESTTVTVKLQLLLSPQVSVAVTFTVVVPIGNGLPLGGLAVSVGVVHPPLAETV